MNYVLLTRMSEAILTKKDYDFNDTKTDLIESGKHGRLLKVLGNCVFQVVLESYAVQTWGFLWCFYSDVSSEQLITPVQVFQFEKFPSLERAYFTQLLPCSDNSDDVFDITVFDELVKKFEKIRECGYIILFNQRGGVCGWLICVSFVLQESSWSIRQIHVLPLRSPWL